MPHEYCTWCIIFDYDRVMVARRQKQVNPIKRTHALSLSLSLSLSHTHPPSFSLSLTHHHAHRTPICTTNTATAQMHTHAPTHSHCVHTTHGINLTSRTRHQSHELYISHLNPTNSILKLPRARNHPIPYITTHNTNLTNSTRII